MLIIKTRHIDSEITRFFKDKGIVKAILKDDFPNKGVLIATIQNTFRKESCVSIANHLIQFAKSFLAK